MNVTVSRVSHQRQDQPQPGEMLLLSPHQVQVHSQFFLESLWPSFSLRWTQPEFCCKWAATNRIVCCNFNSKQGTAGNKCDIDSKRCKEEKQNNWNDLTTVHTAFQVHCAKGWPPLLSVPLLVGRPWCGVTCQNSLQSLIVHLTIVLAASPVTSTGRRDSHALRGSRGNVFSIEAHHFPCSPAGRDC
jgi:hypothetical protein